MGLKVKKKPRESEENRRGYFNPFFFRLRKVDNKFVKTGRVASPADLSNSDDPPQKKILLRESKLELNQSLLERLRNPSQQVEFYEAIQQSMQSADKTPPKLLNSSSNINPGRKSS